MFSLAVMCHPTPAQTLTISTEGQRGGATTCAQSMTTANEDDQCDEITYPKHIGSIQTHLR